jgi:predicted GNAT family acetyltransferase
MDTPDDEIRHHSPDGRSGEFFIQHGDGKRVAELSYTMAGDNAIVSHTYVAPEHRGGTLARRLVDAAASWAIRENHRIIPMCSYVRSVFDKNPDQYGVVRAHPSGV